MIRFISLAALFITLATSLSSCAYFQGKSDQHEAVCKSIKYRMMYNSVTPTRQPTWEQRSETARLNKSYHDEGC